MDKVKAQFELFVEYYKRAISLSLDQEEYDQVLEGTAVPNDFYDANEDVLLAWEQAYKSSPFNEEGHLQEWQMELMNEMMYRVHGRGL